MRRFETWGGGCQNGRFQSQGDNVNTAEICYHTCRWVSLPKPPKHRLSKYDDQSPMFEIYINQWNIRTFNSQILLLSSFCKKKTWNSESTHAKKTPILSGPSGNQVTGMWPKLGIFFTVAMGLSIWWALKKRGAVTQKNGAVPKKWMLWGIHYIHMQHCIHIDVCVYMI
jgi:hypothetical protein